MRNIRTSIPSSMRPITEINSRGKVIDVLPGPGTYSSNNFLVTGFGYRYDNNAEFKKVNTAYSSLPLALTYTFRPVLKELLCSLSSAYKSIDKENFIAFDDIYREYNVYIILIWDLEVFKRGAPRNFVQIFNESVSH